MTPRKGDRVRVTYEAEYQQKADIEPGHFVASGGDLGFVSYVPPYATLEVIEDLRRGDVVLDARDEWSYYVGDSDTRFPWARFYDSHRWGDSEVRRPFKLHIRDGVVLS